jgi:hypothetical protein
LLWICYCQLGRQAEAAAIDASRFHGELFARNVVWEAEKCVWKRRQYLGATQLARYAYAEHPTLDAARIAGEAAYKMKDWTAASGWVSAWRKLEATQKGHDAIQKALWLIDNKVAGRWSEVERLLDRGR